MSAETFLDGRVTLHLGDSLDILRTLAADSVDAVVCDPPYGLGVPPDPIEMLRSWLDTGHLDVSGRGFMGREWDAFVPQPALWREVFRVLKPGGHVLAFFGTRTYDLGSLAIRLAGFEIRDQIGWLYGSGFPKSHDVSKAIDKALGCEREKVRIPSSDLRNPPNLVGGVNSVGDRPWRKRAMEKGFHEAASAEAAEWSGWGTALKPAWEPMVLARKPLVGTVAANVLVHGTGGINIDACRVGVDGGSRTIHGDRETKTVHAFGDGLGARGGRIERPSGMGRHPANILHDGSPEVVDAFPADGAETAARFFYSAKAASHDRVGSRHPTVKPLDLMQWLVRLVTPKGGVVLDAFAGTGTTGEAAWREGMRAVLIEREARYAEDIRRRLRLATRPAERAAVAKAKGRVAEDHGPLFTAREGDEAA